MLCSYISDALSRSRHLRNLAFVNKYISRCAPGGPRPSYVGDDVDFACEPVHSILNVTRVTVVVR